MRLRCFGPRSIEGHLRVAAEIILEAADEWSGGGGRRLGVFELGERRAQKVARFLAERGAKRPEADPLEATIAAIRARGYSVIREDGVVVIDARHRLAGSDALFAFAEARGLRVPPAMQAAE